MRRIYAAEREGGRIRWRGQGPGAHLETTTEGANPSLPASGERGFAKPRGGCSKMRLGFRTRPETICAQAVRDYLTGMDWQSIAALTVVLATAGIFAAKSWPRKPKFSFERDTHCGCSSGGGGAAPTKNSIVFHARKGARGQIIVKMK